MKKAVSVLIAGCVFGALALAPAASTSLSYGVVDAAPSLAIITGTVKDDHGTPLVGAIVALLEPQPRGKEIKSVKTDLQGRFSAGIVPGLYRLRATAVGFASMLTRVNLERPEKVNYDFALKRTDTLVQKRGDSDDYRWIARSSPRHAMNLKQGHEGEEAGQDPGPGKDAKDAGEDADGLIAVEDGIAQKSLAPRQTFHGITQFIASSSAGSLGQPGPSFFGSNFALASSFGGNFEMAVIGQRGVGYLAPQRLAAIATVRPSDTLQVTASIGYGQVALARKLSQDLELMDGVGDPNPSIHTAQYAGRASQLNNASSPLRNARSLDQLSVSATGSWQVFQPLLLIYGFDYSRFMGSIAKQPDSVLPRFAVQYSPSARTRLNAAMTPGSDQRQSQESFNTENIQTAFEDTSAEIAFNGNPILDRSRRFEVGIERLFGNGGSALEASAFYDVVSGHGVGILALPLEASPETQATFQQVVHQVTAMNGASRGVRLMYKKNLSDHVSTAVGYSFGRGSRFNDAAIDSPAPAHLFRGGFFQVATAKLDIDFTHETGTHISTVIRLSPSAVVFAIDPFAGRMSVYDPNINIYVTQELPNFGLPVRWQALVDMRNVLDQTVGVDDGLVQMIAARTRRTVRGGLAFRW